MTFQLITPIQGLTKSLADFEQDVARENHLTLEIAKEILKLEEVIQSHHRSLNAWEVEVTKLPQLTSDLTELDRSLVELKSVVREILINKKNQK